jgi:hypothetical protein
MRRSFALAVAAATMFASSSALAAEALLIRHEVLSVPVGETLELKPGFFIGKAWIADPDVAETSLDTKLRNVRFTARSPGRTIISAWNLREPNKRIEYEIVVVTQGMDAFIPSLPPPAAVPDAPTAPPEPAEPAEPTSPMETDENPTE